jgi:phage gpG-like protein
MAFASGLRLDQGIVSFEFQPSIGILARDIDKLGADISSFEEPLRRAIREVMVPSFKKNFQMEGRPSWVPMSEATRIIRGNKGQGGKLLHRSGALERVVTQESLWSIGPNSATIRDLPSGVSYGKIHQAGFGGGGGARSMASRIRTEMRGGRSSGEAAKLALQKLDRDILSGKARQGGGVANAIPARPFVLFQDEDLDAVQKVFDEWLQEQIMKDWGAGI